MEGGWLGVIAPAESDFAIVVIRGAPQHSEPEGGRREEEDSWEEKEEREEAVGRGAGAAVPRDARTHRAGGSTSSRLGLLAGGRRGGVGYVCPFRVKGAKRPLPEMPKLPSKHIYGPRRSVWSMAPVGGHSRC